MKLLRSVMAAGALLTAAPALAQDDGAEGNPLADMSGIFADLFPAEELPPEATERLPAAELVVAKVFPPGTYAQLMEQVMGPAMDGVMGKVLSDSVARLGAATGLERDVIEAVPAERQAAAMALLDPDAEARNRAVASAFTQVMADVFAQVEPPYRAGLARAYAKRFTREELGELSLFFNTDTGGKYAAESYLIFADPQVLSAMNEALPAMMGMLPQVMERMEGVSAGFAQPRGVGDLSSAEQGRLAELLGVTRAELVTAAPAETE